MSERKRTMDCLKVRMMGGISLEFNGTPFPMPGGVSSKLLQLILILIYMGDKGASRDELLEMLYGREDLSNPAGSLRTTVFRLRKLLEQMGFPEHEYVKAAGGIYRWDTGELLRMDVDIHEFQRAARIGMEKNQQELLLRACGLYRGAFLPQLTAENWVAVASVKARDTYFECLRLLNALLRADGEYDELLALCSRACELYPYEECQIMKIDCLIAMKRFNEAMQVYKEAASQYFTEQGQPPSEKMLERFRIMSGQVLNTADTLDNIRTSLQEKERIEGPYYCTYPSFIDCYRMLVRMSDRSGRSIYLLCCTLLDAGGKPYGGNEELLKKASKKLGNVIGRSLRKGDIYTCYSSSQYLILLNGIAREYCRVTYERIDRNFLDWEESRKFKVDYQVLPIETL